MEQNLAYNLVHEEISADYWQSAELSPMATEYDDYTRKQASHTFPHKLSDNQFGTTPIFVYTEVQANWNQITTIWPNGLNEDGAR